MSFNSKYKGSEVEELLDSIGNKVDKVDGKQLSTEDFTTILKQKLEGLNNYNDAELTQALSSLQSQLNTLVSGNASSAINSFNEIISFLEGVSDSENLDNIIAAINQNIAAKQNEITDLAAIRSGASKGATALQPQTGGSGTKFLSDDNTYKEIDIPEGDFATKEELDEKQDKVLKFTNLNAVNWVSDSTYNDYPYRCDLQCSGVTSDMYAEVVFSVMQASGGDYAPICETKTNVVSIWSKQNVTISVPTVIITK